MGVGGVQHCTVCHFQVILDVLLDTKSNENTRAVDIGGDMMRVGASGGTGWLMSARGEFQSTGVEANTEPPVLVIFCACIVGGIDPRFNHNVLPTEECAYSCC